MNKEVDQPYKATIEDQRKQALEHYNELATKCCHWSSFVANAIKAYNPESTLGKEIEDLQKQHKESLLLYQNMCEQITKDQTRIRELEEALRECEEYFESRADADHNGENFVPNKEMKLLSNIRKLLKDE